VDLGKNITANEILEKIKSEKPDAIGLSALLVSTSNEMQAIAQQMESQNLQVPVMIGGAAVDESFANSIAKKVNFKFPIFYCKDSFSGLNVVKNVSDKLKSSEFILNHISKQKNSASENIAILPSTKLKISDESKINISEFAKGLKLCRELRLDDKNKIFESYKDFDYFDLIEAKYVYGVFAAKKALDSNVLEIYNSDNQLVSTLNFTFYKDKVPLSHYYSEHKFFPIALFGLTIGDKFDVLSTDEFKNKHYKHGLELHSLKADAAEKLADFVQAQIESVLKIGSISEKFFAAITLR
jgi:5-methyltetrahydrofolate--homocysteine methyltransferase